MKSTDSTMVKLFQTAATALFSKSRQVEDMVSFHFSSPPSAAKVELNTLCNVSDTFADLVVPGQTRQTGQTDRTGQTSPSPIVFQH